MANVQYINYMLQNTNNIFFPFFFIIFATYLFTTPCIVVRTIGKHDRCRTQLKFFFFKSLKLVFTTTISSLDNYSPDRKKFTLTMQTITRQTTECIGVHGLEFTIFSLKKTKAPGKKQRAEKRKLNNDKFEIKILAVSYQLV